MFLDDTLNDRQAEAGAFVFGGEKGFEDMCQVFGRDAVAGVGDYDFYPRADECSLYRQRPAIGHGVDGVEKKVDENLFELVGVGEGDGGDVPIYKFSLPLVGRAREGGWTFIPPT